MCYLYEKVGVFGCAEAMKQQAQEISSGGVYRYTVAAREGLKSMMSSSRGAPLGDVFVYWRNAPSCECLPYLVVKESLMIMPAFGVQLEEHFWSGRVHRQFVPVGKILKLVLNECVTPVTCYWSLALLLHDEDKMMLVFKVNLACFRGEL